MIETVKSFHEIMDTPHFHIPIMDTPQFHISIMDTPHFPNPNNCFGESIFSHHICYVTTYF